MALRHILPFLIWLFTLACDKQPEADVVGPVPTPPPGSNPPPTGNSLRYLALGDSYTIGQGVIVEDRFPVQTWRLLQGAAVNMQEPEIIAVTGWTTQRLQEALQTQNPAGPFDMVTLLIGVNDQYQRLSIDGYRTRFEQLLQESIRLAGNRPRRVVVLSIPDYSVTPFAQNLDRDRIRQEIDAFNQVNREISLARDVHYLDITASTREAATDPTLVASDGLHPSGREYARWAVRLLALMKPEFP